MSFTLPRFFSRIECEAHCSGFVQVYLFFCLFASLNPFFFFAGCSFGGRGRGRDCRAWVGGWYIKRG